MSWLGDDFEPVLFLANQTERRVSAFVAAVGTGSTLAGVSAYLKEQNPKIEIVCADPYGAAMWSWFTNGNLETNDGDSIAEGISQPSCTKHRRHISYTPTFLNFLPFGVVPFKVTVRLLPSAETTI